MKNNSFKKHTGRRTARTAALIAAAAALLATTAFATGLFGLRTESVGKYGMKISADYDNAEQTASQDAGGSALSFAGGDPARTHCVSVTPTWLPKGMENVVGETMKFCFADDPSSGISIMQHILNTGKASFCMLLTDVQSREELTVDGHEAVYVSTGGHDRLYISYPEENVVLELYIMNMDKSDALRFAQGLTLAEGEGAFDLDYSTELYQAAAEGRDGSAVENASDEPSVDEDGWISDDYSYAYKLAISKEEMNAHAVGESFPFNFSVDGFRNTPLDIKVTDVAVADDFSPLLDQSCIDSDMTALLDANGKLPMNTIEFIQLGDGINKPARTVVATQEEQLKLVAVTMDITNNTGKDLENICFYGSLLPVVETENGYAVYRSALDKTLLDGTDYDYFDTGRWYRGEMCYYSVHGEGNGNGSNYIDSLAAGETVTLQIGWIVNEGEVPYLYLNMLGDDNIFSRDELEAGYVKLFK